jgi:predicted transcriptional regulator
VRPAIRIEDEILRQLNEWAPRENIPHTRLIERTLRAGLVSRREWAR